MAVSDENGYFLGVGSGPQERVEEDVGRQVQSFMCVGATTHCKGNIHFCLN